MLRTVLLLLSVFVLVAQACNPPHLQTDLARWSDATTWGGTLPVAGDTVNIAAGQKILFDLESSPVYAEVNISGTLVFDEQTTAVELNAENIFIQNGGLLQIGAECCFYTGKAIITLHQPSDTGYNPYGVGNKVLGITAGGSLELFGEIPDPSWTVLAMEAQKGDTEINLVTEVEGYWHINDTVVIASTDFNADQTEQRVITDILGSKLTLDSALTYTHNAEITYDVNDERAEVAVLDRRILIRGEATSSDVAGYGGHIMAIKDFDHVYIQGVEITKAGQYNKKGRYPIHFHLCGDVEGRAYVKDCSIHHNYQRSITIHGTHNLIVRRNVAYDTKGHSYFIEDGIETGNELSWNLGIIARSVPNSEVQFDGSGNVAGGILLSDSEPSIFWITNPDNTVRNNVAVGGQFGFWLAFPVNPHGPSSTPTIFPIRTPLREFAYNKAHSVNSDGLFVDRGPDATSRPNGGAYNPLEDPTNTSSAPKEAVFSAFAAYKCRNRGTWIRGGLVRVENAVYADNAIGATFAINTRTGLMEDSIFIGETNNYGNPASWEVKGENGRSVPRPWDVGNASWPIRGWEYYDGPVSFDNCRFYAFNTVPTTAGSRIASAISMLRADQFSIAPSNDANQFQIADSSGPNVYFADYVHDGDKASVFIDLDGSVTGRPPSNGLRATVLNKNDALATSKCDTSYLSQWSAYVCPDQYGFLHVDYADNTLPTPPPANSWLTLYREDQSSSTNYTVCGGLCPPDDGKTDNNFFATVVRNKGYMMKFTMPSTAWVPDDLHLVFQYTDIGNYLIIGVCYPTGTTIKTLSYNYKSQNVTGDYAANRNALDTASDNNADWSNRGKYLWTRQDADGYIWFKMYPHTARDSSNARSAYPAAEISMTVNLGTVSGFTSGCPIRSHTQVTAEKDLPPKANVASPSSFDSPSVAFVGRTDNEVCGLRSDSSPASSLSAFWVSVLSFLF